MMTLFAMYMCACFNEKHEFFYWDSSLIIWAYIWVGYGTASTVSYGLISMGVVIFYTSSHKGKGHL